MSQLAQRLFMASASGKKDSTYVEDVFDIQFFNGNNTYPRLVPTGIKLSNANAGSSVNFANYGSLVVPTSADFKFGTGAFTVEFYIYFLSSTDYISIFDGRPVSTNGNQTTMNMHSDGKLNWYDLTNSQQVIAPSGSTQLTVGAWTHVAFVREGTGTNQAKLYFNGSLVGTGTDPQDYAVNQLNRIGGQPWSPGVGNFSISNYRVVKGTAVYTSNFTTPTAPLTDISGTVLLCCQSSTDPFAAAVTPGTITIGSQSQAVPPVAQSFGTETASDAKGGLLIGKSRANGYGWAVWDTERGAGDTALRIDNAGGQNNAAVGPYVKVDQFNNGGFRYNQPTAQDVFNANNEKGVFWTFAKQKGFFDVVTYTGNNTAGRQIPHNLGCRPGMVVIKCTSDSHNWTVWHRGLSSNAKGLILNDDGKEYTTDDFNGAAPTSEVIFLSATNNSNGAGKTYVAYLWAGGESTAATARSAYFDSSNINRLGLDDSPDWIFGDTFTLEAWIKLDSIPSSGYQHICAHSANYGFYCTVENANKRLQFYDYHSNTTINSATGSLVEGQWMHVALVDNSGTAQWYINGIPSGSSGSLDVDYDEAYYLSIGGSYGGNQVFGGYISNLRIVKGTAVYTSAFRPSTKPLTSITNTVLLCCQTSTVTDAAVSPGSITNLGNSGNLTTASTQSPFDDPNGFKFGGSNKENLIKCGSYAGNSTANHEIYVGWEPQWWLVKNITDDQNWQLLDSMRGWVSDGNDQYLVPNNASQESPFNFGNPTPTGFNLSNASSNWQNQSGKTYVYVAIRRPDGLVGKPPVTGTEVFAMDNGNASTIIPAYDSGFPVDFGLDRQFASSENWYTSTRLMGQKWLRSNDPNTENTGASYLWDSNLGYIAGSWASSNYQSWMFKRHAGLDVVTYRGNNSGSNGQQIPHSLGKIPEMIWVKCRSTGYNWYVYNKDQNGGTNPQNYYLRLNHADAEQESVSPYDVKVWNDTAPTSTHFSVGPPNDVNQNGQQFVSMLFASVEGISKVGSYGGSNSAQTITTGFQPRFVIIKNLNDARNWQVIDTRRGWGAGNDCRLFLDLQETQICTSDVGAPTATGFTLTGGNQRWNIAGDNYIYYAHA